MVPACLAGSWTLSHEGQLDLGRRPLCRLNGAISMVLFCGLTKYLKQPDCTIFTEGIYVFQRIEAKRTLRKLILCQLTNGLRYTELSNHLSDPLVTVVREDWTSTTVLSARLFAGSKTGILRCNLNVIRIIFIFH